MFVCTSAQVCAMVAKKFEEHGLAIPAERLFNHATEAIYCPKRHTLVTLPTAGFAAWWNAWRRFDGVVGPLLSACVFLNSFTMTGGKFE